MLSSILKEVFMKKQKLDMPRMPWWCFDFINERKGFWKKLHNRLARRRGKRELEKELE